MSLAASRLSKLFALFAAFVLFCGSHAAWAADDCSDVYNHSAGSTRGYFYSPNLTAGETVLVNLTGASGTFTIQNAAHTVTYAIYAASSSYSFLVPSTAQYAFNYSSTDQAYLIGCGIAAPGSGTITTVPPYTVTPPAPYNFGSVDLPSSAQRTVTFTIPGGGSGTIASADALTMGAKNLDFTTSGSDTCTGASLASAGTCSVTVTFAPQRAGWRKGGVLLKDSNGNVVSAAYLQGIGHGAELAYQYGTPVAYSNVPKGAGVNVFGPLLRFAVDGNGVLFQPGPLAWNYNKFPSPYSGTSPSPTTVTTNLVFPGYDTETGQNYDATLDPNTFNSTTAAVDGVGNIYITGAACDCDDNRGSGIMRVDPAGKAVVFYSYSIPNTLTTPIGVAGPLAVGGDGKVYVFSIKYDPNDTTAGLNSLDPYTAAVTHVTIPGFSLKLPFAAAIDSTGSLYVADGAVSSAIPTLYKITGATFTTVDLGTTFALQQFYLSSVAVDSLDNLFLASAGSDTSRSSLIYVVPVKDPTHPYTLPNVASTSLHAIGALTFDAQDNLYVEDLPAYNPSAAQARSIYYFPLQDQPSTSITAFSAQAKGSASVSHTLTLTNIGNAPLSITVPGSGTNPSFSGSSFIVAANTDTNACVASPTVTIPVGDVCARFGACSSILANSCTLQVASTPHAASGSISGTLAIQSNLSSTQSNIGFTGTATAGVTALKLTGIPLTAAEAAFQTATVTAYDGSNNVFTAYAGTTHLSLTNPDVSASIPSDYIFAASDNGAKQFQLALSAPGAQTVNVTDALNSLSDSANTTVFLPLDHFAFTAAPPASTTAGTSFSVTVTAYSDSGSTVATGYAGSVAITSSDASAVLPTTGLTLTNGAGSFNITLKTVGSQTITVADSSGTPSKTSGNITVNAAAAARIAAVSGGHQSAVTDNAFANPLVVQSVDAYGNPVAGITVNLIIPTNGAGLRGGTYQCITSASATPAASCSISITANSIAGDYSVTAGSGVLTPVSFSLTNNPKTEQSITFANPGTQTFGTAPTLSASANSSLAVTFTSNTTPACTITSGGALAFVTVGNCSISADQAGNSTYSAATTVTRSFTVQAASQTITFPQPTSPVTYSPSATVTLSATGGNSGNAVTFFVSSGPGTVNGNTLTINGTGTIVVAANQVGNTNYSAATEVTRSIVVQAASQAITFTQPTSPISYIPAATVALSATGGNSGNAVTFSVSSGPGTVNGSTLTVNGTGTIVVAANQVGNTNYSAAAQATRNIVVQAASQTITFTQPTSPSTYGSAATVSLSASGGASGNPVTLNIASGPASLSGSTLTITGAGTIVVSANQAGNSNYTAATEVQRSIVVNKASATLTGPTLSTFVVFSQAGSVPVSIAGQYSGTGISAPSGSIGYTITNASSAAVASGLLTIASGAVTVPVANTLAPGLYTVNASYAGDANYSAATPITAQLQVGQIQPAISWSPAGSIAYGTTLAGILTAQAKDGSQNVIGTYSYFNGSSAVTSATVLLAGSYTLTVNFTPTDAVTYKTATANVGLSVTKIAPSILLVSSVNPILLQNATVLTATLSSAVSTPTGTVTFLDGTTSLGTSTLSSGVATLSISTLAVGTHSITAVYAGDANFSTVSSSPVSQQVNDFNLNLTISGGSGSASQTSQTVLPGGSVTYTFTVTPTGSTTFPAQVNLTVTGLPSGATYTITPNSIAKGAGATNITLTVTVPPATSKLEKTEKLVPMALALLLLPFAGRMRRKAKGLPRLIAVLLLLLGRAAGIAGLTGCGATTGFFGQQPQSYTVTITGTSGALVHSTTVTLTVE